MSLMPKNVASYPAARAGRVAVLLNANARKVGPKVRSQFQSLVPNGDLYWSRSLSEAEDHVGRIVERGYSTVFTGGGDGTICNTINTLHDQLRGRIPRPECPNLGILKLGTGNAMAYMVGAHSPAQHLQSVLGGARPQTQRLSLIEESGRLLPFAGIGWDAAVLNDYINLKKRYDGALGRRLFHSILGYFAAIGMKTVPREVLRREPSSIRVRNLGNAVHILPDGRELPIPKGTLLFDGTSNFVGVATIPYYGYGMQVFPYAASVPGRMHLRIVTMSVFETLTHLPAIWKGSYRSPGIMDFLVDSIEVESDDPVPFQVGGDAQGERQKLTFSTSPYSIELLDFRGAQA